MPSRARVALNFEDPSDLAQRVRPSPFDARRLHRCWRAFECLPVQSSSFNSMPITAMWLGDLPPIQMHGRFGVDWLQQTQRRKKHIVAAVLGAYLADDVTFVYHPALPSLCAGNAPMNRASSFSRAASQASSRSASPTRHSPFSSMLARASLMSSICFCNGVMGLCSQQRARITPWSARRSMLRCA